MRWKPRISSIFNKPPNLSLIVCIYAQSKLNISRKCVCLCSDAFEHVCMPNNRKKIKTKRRHTHQSIVTQRCTGIYSLSQNKRYTLFWMCPMLCTHFDCSVLYLQSTTYVCKFHAYKVTHLARKTS